MVERRLSHSDRLFKLAEGDLLPSLAQLDQIARQRHQHSCSCSPSLRHTYATLELLNKGTDIHTLSKQMGNSAAMIERHYSKLTATMAADKLACGVVSGGVQVIRLPLRV